MIRFVQGNLLDAPTEALVNTINTVGVMGKGIALMFREAFPENFRAYREAVKRDEVQVGRMFVTENRALLGPRWLINFPTKQHWLQPSRPEWIGEGLPNGFPKEDLRRVIQEKQICSIAVPPLGCGNGGLEWAGVRPQIVRRTLLADRRGHLDFRAGAKQYAVCGKSVTRLSGAGKRQRACCSEPPGYLLLST